MDENKKSTDINDKDLLVEPQSSEELKTQLKEKNLLKENTEKLDEDFEEIEDDDEGGFILYTGQTY